MAFCSVQSNDNELRGYTFLYTVFLLRVNCNNNRVYYANDVTNEWGRRVCQPIDAIKINKTPVRAVRSNGDCAKSPNTFQRARVLMIVRFVVSFFGRLNAECKKVKYKTYCGPRRRKIEYNLYILGIICERHKQHWLSLTRVLPKIDG